MLIVFSYFCQFFSCLSGVGLACCQTGQLLPLSRESADVMNSLTIEKTLLPSSCGSTSEGSFFIRDADTYQACNVQEGYPDRPCIIEFNGLQRCGKGTQIALLENFLTSRGIPCFSMRGEYDRMGTGNSLDDPYSGRRQKYWKSDAMHDLKSQKMRKELRYVLKYKYSNIFPQYSCHTGGFLLVDRGGLGRCMQDAVRGKRTSLAQALSIEPSYVAHGGKENRQSKTSEMMTPKIPQESIMPHYLPYADAYIVLQPTKEELLRRACCAGENVAYKMEIIQQTYEKFYEGYEQSKYDIPTALLHITSHQSPDDIHADIVGFLQQVPWLKGVLHSVK